MARPVRIDVAGGWYHVTNRGNERRAIFRDDKDRLRFLELLAKWPGRFEIRLHAYVLMDNHFHLFVETPAANLSRAMQWLQVAYTVWFNRRHQRAGHLFQGRFKAVLVEAASAAWEVSRYLHLNPIRMRQLGLGKLGQARLQTGTGDQPDPQQVAAWLKRLREYRWSSYRAYAGLTGAPTWLTTETILNLGGGHSRTEQSRSYRQFVEAALRAGVAASPWERLEAGLLLGQAEFVRRMKQLAQGDRREQPQLRGLKIRPSWGRIVAVVEAAKAEKWEQFRDRHGDWGRDLAWYLGRHHGGLSLKALATAAGVANYQAVAMAVNRFERRLQRERPLQTIHHRAEVELLNI